MATEAVKLFTQNELAQLNTQLDQIRKNLTVHLDGSLSKVHGINIVQTPYFDNGGDRVGSMCLAFHFGTPPNDTTVYVPARLATEYSTPGDIGPHTDSSSLATPSSSAGVPITLKSLVTESPAANAYEQASVYNQILLAHSTMVIDDTREMQAHGGTSYTTEDTYDSLSHTVGRNTVTIGVNGRAYKLPGDTDKQSAGYGPPQAPRGAKLYTLHEGKQWCNRVHHGADDDQYGTVRLIVPTSSSTFKTIWQTNGATTVGWPTGSSYNLSTVWYDLNPTGAGGVSGKCQKGRQPCWFTVAAANKSVQFHYQAGSDSGVPVQFCRVKFVGDFGESYTNVCLFSANDEDGSWMFSGPDDHTDYYYDGRLPGASTLHT